MMSTQRKSEHGVIQSSIALLQERFRQLQREKEMREKKELLRMFSDYKNTSTITTVSTCPNNNNNHYEPYPHDTKLWSDPDASDNDELQVFLPPNYYSKYSCKPSCFSPTSTPSHSNHNRYNLNEVSLSLWPPMHYNNAGANHFRQASFEAPLSTMSMLGPPSRVYKFEDSHVSDVDTTLHL